jgi:predicted neuraminidase
VEEVAGKTAVSAVDFVFEDGPTPACHAATIAVLGDGSEVVAWFGGTREGADDVAIWSARRPSTADPWSEPALAARARDVPCWNPVLFEGHDGRVLLFYKAGPSPQTWSGRVAVSTDGGRTWPERRALPPGVVGPAKNKPLRTPDGRVLCPSSTESHMAWGAWIEETDDDLARWRKHGPIYRDGVGIIQPALVQGDDDEHLVALCRTANARQVARTESRDGGRAWSEPTLIDVAHNNSGLDAARLVDGRVVLVANAVTSGRTPLHLLVSDDLGRTFGTTEVIDDEPGELSYPSVVAAGSTVRVVYTWRRERIACRTVEV